MGEHGEYIADETFPTPEYLEQLRNMTDDEFAQHIEELKKQED